MKVGPYTLDEYQERAGNEVRASLAAGGRARPPRLMVGNFLVGLIRVSSESGPTQAV